MKKSKYFPLGTSVKIVIPKIFIRCGYTLDFLEIKKQKGEEIIELMTKLSRVFDEYLMKDISDTIVPLQVLMPYDRKVNNYLDKACCAFLLRQAKFGGNERKIFEYDEPNLLGKIGVIVKKEYVKTGIYSPGHSSQSIYGDEYEPAYLDDEKTHCIYTIHKHNDLFAWDYKILSANVEKEIRNETNILTV